MTNRIAAKSSYTLAGHLLVAAPGWNHQVFGRSVCLVVHHDDGGAVGILLNHHLEGRAEGLWKHLGGGQAEYRQEVLHCGGPHSGPVVALHDCQEFAEFSGGEGVYVAAQVENLKSLIRATESTFNIKIIAGQAAWQRGELEAEFAAGKWLPLAVSSKLVFTEGRQMWQLAMRDIGNRLVADVTGRPLPSNILNN